jgi:hypothetical protein
MTKVYFEAPGITKNVYNLSFNACGLLMIQSGFILVKGVVDIYLFFKKRNATNYINTGMLLRHAGAFGLYLLADAANFISFTV